ncbi:polysaccharide biosynthesis tyrosine autokinase [Pannus brasiliensis CCIBt3594]|uniref:Polysaccharide biosynthesis tyrosine autokinase n=1 Tax=Pannus brasiliensis CCIBt3594 TaxID=1427578 RepID=A0AAW9QRN7_9CHRO
MIESTDVGYGQLLAILWRRRFWFSGVFISVFLVASFFALQKKPTYMSSMQLLVEPNYQPKPERESGTANTFIENNFQIDYATQLNLLRGSVLIRKAIDKVKKEYPRLTIAAIQRNLLLEQIRTEKTETKIFNIAFSAGDPIESLKILQAMREVYQEYNLEQQQKRLSDGLGFVNKQLPLARQNLRSAEVALKQFRAANNLIDPQAEANTLVAGIRAIEAERESLKAQYREARVRRELLQKNLDRPGGERVLDSSRLSQSTRYQNLLTNIQETELALAERRSMFTDSHPLVRELLEKRQNIQKLLREEKEKILGKASPAESDTALQKQGQYSPIDLETITTLLNTDLAARGLQERERSLAKTEAQLQAELARFPAWISEYNRLSQEVEVRRTTLQQLLQAQQTLAIELDRGGFNWQVVESPRAGVKVGPNRARDLLVAGVVALFVGGIAAFARETLDDSIHTSDQLERQGVLPLLGATPKWRPLEARGANLGFPWRASPEETSPILSIVGWQPFRESLDLIYKTLQLLEPGTTRRSLAIASTLPGEGKSTLTLGLALSAGRLHRRVLVIDANLREPFLHELFQLPNDQGLSNWLAGESDRPSPHALSFAGSSIDLLTAGPKPKDPVKLLTSRRMEELMEEFGRLYDLILLDTPAILGRVDALQIASQAKGTILVARLDRVTQSQIAEATERLRPLSPLGIIANGAREVSYPREIAERNGQVSFSKESSARN